MISASAKRYEETGPVAEGDSERLEGRLSGNAFCTETLMQRRTQLRKALGGVCPGVGDGEHKRCEVGVSLSV